MIYWFLISIVNLLKWVYRAQNPEWLRFEYLLTQNIVRKAGRGRGEKEQRADLASSCSHSFWLLLHLLHMSWKPQGYNKLLYFCLFSVGKIRAPPVLEQLIYIVTKWAAPEEFSNVQWFCQFSPTSLLSCPTSDKSSPHRHLLLSVVLWLKSNLVFLLTYFRPTYPPLPPPLQWGRKAICCLPLLIFLPSFPSQFLRFSSSSQSARKGIHRQKTCQKLKRSYWRKNSSLRECFQWFQEKTTQEEGEEEQKKKTGIGLS